MKKRKAIVFLLLCGILLMSGCQKAKEEKEGPAFQQENKIDGTKTEEGKKAEEAETENAEGTESQENAHFPRELDKQELREFTIWINQGDNYGNYGFLLSEYEKPQDIDLNELLYTGAGMETEQLSKKEIEAFLKATGQEEIYTDCTRLTTAQINEFLKRKLGISMEEATHPLECVYLPEFDIWVNEHGDTNYMNFTCVSGRQIDGRTYELDCVPGDDVYKPIVSSCQLTVCRDGSDYQFISNQFVEDLPYFMEIWKIEDQCFDVDLEGWGNVTFNSYGPDVSTYGDRDVIFTLDRNGEQVYKFPFAVEENYRMRETFVRILAVSFKDYDEDGDKDIIVISEYEPMVKTEDGGNNSEVRLYLNDAGDQEFRLDADQMDYLNTNGWNHTIAEVMEHIHGSGRPIWEE